MGVLDAVQADVALLTVEGRASGIAALALSLAAAMDAEPSAALARELRETLAKVNEMPRAHTVTTAVGQLAERRAKRLAS